MTGHNPWHREMRFITVIKHFFSIFSFSQMKQSNIIVAVKII